MATVDFTNARWRKSSRSGSDTDCVEIAELPEVVAVRDSKDPSGPVLTFPHATWSTFVRHRSVQFRAWPQA